MCRNQPSPNGNPRPSAVRPPGPVGSAAPPSRGGPVPAGSAPPSSPQQPSAQAANGPAALLQNLVDSLTRGRTFSGDELNTLRAALNSFGDPQRRTFLEAGVRFWPVDSLPPEIDEAWQGDQPEAPDFGHHITSCRTIRIQPNCWTRHVVVHELTHAWDRLRGRSNLTVFDSLPVARRRTALRRENRTDAWSEGNLVNAYEQYRATLLRYGTNGRPSQRTYELSFDGGGAAMRGYSFQRNVREFYAEGYAVFNGGFEAHQVRMYAFARPLFDTLRNEAQQMGLPVPNQAHLLRAGRQEGILR